MKYYYRDIKKPWIGKLILAGYTLKRSEVCHKFQTKNCGNFFPRKLSSFKKIQKKIKLSARGKNFFWLLYYNEGTRNWLKAFFFFTFKPFYFDKISAWIYLKKKKHPNLHKPNNIFQLTNRVELRYILFNKFSVKKHRKIRSFSETSALPS